MKYEAFIKATEQDTPPTEIPPLLLSLWHIKKGDWSAAHDIAQEIETADGSWVHAYLHRIEGDDWNAGYWYRRAGRDFPTQNLDDEWEILVRHFLDIFLE
ncbi:MAG: hypothetical protein DHS20C18_34110 [Saprospiraceae bacterium]|nr:MAG: hypothetical protein DHS20C18_34110 [Saprospiraceae bacterium]